MHRSRTFVALGAALAVAATALAPPTTSAARSQAEVLLSGLSSPKGIAINGERNPVVAQGAFGPPGPVLVYLLRGRDRGIAVEVTEPFNLVDVAISPLDGTGWALSPDPTNGHVVLFHQLTDGTIVPVLDIADYQATDPDPVDTEGIPDESNAYGLTVMPGGDALVADAAGNDVIRVTPEGVATTVARFDLEAVATDHLGDPNLPPTIPAEAVPTSVVVGRDGAIYVGELKGFPFRPGSSHVWRIDPDAEDAWCSVNEPDPACTVYADGFTAIQDVAWNRAGTRLYVYELAADGVLAFEAGFETGVFPPAVLLEVRGNKRTELAAGELSQPGGVAVAPNGRIFVTDGVFGDGRLLQIR